MKKIPALLLVFAMIFALAACGGGASSPPPPPSGGTNTPAPPPPSGGGTPAAPEAPAAPEEEPWADTPEVVLVLTQQDPDHSLPGQYCFAWADAVYQESRGRIEVQVNNGGVIAGSTILLDATQSGVADVAHGCPHFYPGRFPMTDMTIMPFMPYKSSVHASEVFMDIWENSDILQTDPGWKGVKVLTLRAMCDVPIITASKKLTSAADMRGMRFRATIAPLQNWLAELGAVGEGCPIGELFQNLQNGTFDGALTDWHGVFAFRFHDNCAKYFADEKVQFAMYFLIMNEDVYNRMSLENQAAIDRVSGMAAFEIMKSAWDDLAEQVKYEIENEFGGEVYNLPAGEINILREAAEKTNAAYVASQGDQGKKLYDLILSTAERLS